MSPLKKALVLPSMAFWGIPPASVLTCMGAFPAATLRTVTKNNHCGETRLMLLDMQAFYGGNTIKERRKNKINMKFRKVVVLVIAAFEGEMVFWYSRMCQLVRSVISEFFKRDFH